MKYVLLQPTYYFILWYIEGVTVLATSYKPSMVSSDTGLTILDGRMSNTNTTYFGYVYVISKWVIGVVGHRCRCKIFHSCIYWMIGDIFVILHVDKDIIFNIFVSVEQLDQLK